MRTELTESEKITGFTLKNIHRLPVDQTLASDIPEEIILSILADYPKADAERVIASIITKLRLVSKDEASLKKSVQQLLILSRLRKLGTATEKQIEDMPITYDVEKDFLYKRGVERKTIQVIQEMLKDGSLANEQIARFTGASVKYVDEVKRGLK
jgi:hypothetical protein